MKVWYKQRTTWTGISAVTAAVGSYLTGTIELSQAVQLVVTGLIGIFLRQSIENK